MRKKRRRLMADQAAYCESQPAAVNARLGQGSIKRGGEVLWVLAVLVVHSYWQIAQRRLRSIGAGGFEDGAELHGTRPMGIGNSKVLGVSGARSAGS